MGLTCSESPVSTGGCATMEPHPLAPSGVWKALKLFPGGRKEVKTVHGDILIFTMLCC